MNNLAKKEVGLAVFFVTALVLSSLVLHNVPEHAAAQSLSAGQDVLLDPVKPIIYWAGADGNDLRFINSTSGDVISSIVVGNAPSSICLSSDGTTLYVAIPLYKCIVVVDERSHSLIGNISLPFYPLSVRLDGKGFMYVSGSVDTADWIYSIDMNSRKIKDSVTPGLRNLAIEISPDGTTLLAVHMGSDSVKIYKYGINAGIFNYIDVDNSDLGSNLQQEAVDWTRGRIYLASGWPYGIELVSIDTLNRLGMYPMEAYPTCVAMSSDGRFLYGAQGYTQNTLWMFNATDGSLMGTTSLPIPTGHLAISHNLESAYVGLQIQRIPLIPLIEHIYPVPGSQLGYTPRYFTVRVAGGLPRYDAQNATANVDTGALALSFHDTDGYWTYYRASFSQVLPEGVHSFSVSTPWIGRILWDNATFTIDRNSSLSLKPTLYPDKPSNNSVQPSVPLNISASVVYPSVDWVTQGGWIVLDDLNLSTQFTLVSLSASYGNTLSNGWHNISACVYWDDGLGKAWANWSFLVMEGPLMIPIYPARDQVLTRMPDHIEVSVDFRDARGNVSAPQLYLDDLPVATVISQTGTMIGGISKTIKGGNHSVKATLTWAAGRTTMTWWFNLDLFVGPTDEVLVQHEYKNEFSLLVPNGSRWVLEEDADLSGEIFPLVMYGPTYGNFRTNIIISSIHDGSVEENEAYLDRQLNQAIDELEQSGMSAAIVFSPEMRTVDNHTAYVAVIEIEGYGIYQGIAIIASEAHERVWVIIFSISEVYYNTYSEMFDRMVDGFKIEMKPTSSGGDLGQAAIGLGIAALAGGLAGTIVWLFRKRRAPPVPK